MDATLVPAASDDDSAAAPRPVRQAVSLAAFATRGDGEVVEVTVTNLSYDGCELHSATPLITGEELQLAVVRKGVIKAQVRWTDGDN